MDNQTSKRSPCVSTVKLMIMKHQ
ncbi:hypothetical protein CY0110_19902 [Crocosphaera chwakensis CCY0110]|uniref:Uncharacterized protein n=1 Tax=Crocosphaera chwakensis CCY0110 TaxID=391612 RepID=A3IJW2_9CHRO|nr:hypothetical protein CY0110_19902 [Crocosphaera chwakensis CCY0110]